MCVVLDEMENQDHLLIRSFTNALWFRALEEMGLVWVAPRSLSDLFEVDLGCDLGKRDRIF